MTQGTSAIKETPAEYIRKAKELYPQAESDTTFIPPIVKEFYGGSEETARKHFETFRDNDYAYELLTRLMPGLPEIFPELINEEHIAVGAVNNPFPNACAVRLEGYSYAVVFNKGLKDFLYRVTRSLSTRFHPSGENISAEEVAFEETCRILSDVFFWYKETGRAGGPNYSVSKHQVIIASMLATEAESFFLAHELGHIFNDLRACAMNLAPVDREAAWSNEFEADRFALTALINSRNQEGSSTPLEICYAGAEIALSTFVGLGELGIDFGTSHPPAQERLNAIRQHIRAICADDYTYERITSFSKNLEVIFLRIIEKLKSPDWESFLGRVTTDVMTELELLLNHCTGGIVPDYVTFKTTVPSLFDKLMSHRLYERVAHAAAEFARHMQAIEKKTEYEKHDAWITFQKYKLFMSMIMDMNEPFKSLLEEALEISN